MAKGGLNRGFTLLEVMAALAILGIAVTVALEIFSGDLRLARKSQEFSRAVFYGRQMLEELCLRQDFPKKAEEGVFEGNFRWRYQIDPVLMVNEEQEEQYKLEVYRIKVDVLWPGKSHEKSLRFETLKTLAKKEESQWNTNNALLRREKAK